MSKLLDDAIEDWGERVGYGKVKGRKGRNIVGGSYSKPALNRAPPASKARLIRTISKAPEVMVKISGGAKDMGGIKAHMDYISRDGDIELENEHGEIVSGKEAVRETRDNWKDGDIPYENGWRKEAFNIVLSMPPGTDRAAVKNAAREFAKALFDGHQYAFAAHDDEKHPHVHLTVKASSEEGIRLNPRKADLQQWRETFAEKLQEFGIEANATPRQARGVVRKPEKQVIRHIQKDYKVGKRTQPARVLVGQSKAANDEITGKAIHQNPAKANIVAARKTTHAAYKGVAEALLKGDQQDRRLALQLINFVKAMPPLKTQHELVVERLCQPAQVVGGVEKGATQEKTKKGIELER